MACFNTITITQPPSELSPEVLEKLPFCETIISLVMEQVSCTREEVIEALKRFNGDIAPTVMYLSSTIESQTFCLKTDTCALKEIPILSLSFSEQDVALVMSKVSCTREEVFQALKRFDGDIVETIMHLSDVSDLQAPCLKTKTNEPPEKERKSFICKYPQSKGIMVVRRREIPLKWIHEHVGEIIASEILRSLQKTLEDTYHAVIVGKDSDSFFMTLPAAGDTIYRLCFSKEAFLVDKKE